MFQGVFIIIGPLCPSSSGHLSFSEKHLHSTAYQPTTSKVVCGPISPQTLLASLHPHPSLPANPDDIRGELTDPKLGQLKTYKGNLHMGLTD